MTDIVLNTDELVVLGGPANISVETSIGQQGQRGSRIFAGNGNPNSQSTVIGQTPEIFDMYINLAPADEEYLYMYQYILNGPSPTWVPLFKIIPNAYSDNNLVNFSAGVGTVLIPVSSIIPEGLVSSAIPDNFNIIATAASNSPVAISADVSPNFVEDSEILNLEIKLYGAKFNGSTWSNLSGTELIYLYITLGQNIDLIS